MGTISIIGSGGMATAIGGLAVKAGHTVELASRNAARAQALADQLGAGAKTVAFGVAPGGDESLGLRPMDTGPLSMARTLEHFALLSLGLVAHAIKHTRFSLGVNLPG
jgi:predicted dinucleotide-binding enzyme